MGRKILKGLLNLKGVYWPPGEYNRHGEISFGSPIEIACKWTNTHAESVDSQGVRYTTSGQILTEYPIQTGGWVWRGSLDEMPVTPPERQILRSVNITDSVSNDEKLYTGGY